MPTWTYGEFVTTQKYAVASAYAALLQSVKNNWAATATAAGYAPNVASITTSQVAMWYDANEVPTTVNQGGSPVFYQCLATGTVT